MRSPFTGIVFAFELTHDMNVILPLLVASVIAHAFTSLTLKRSILTEKVARRGYHLSREYSVDPLEVLFAREVMRTNLAVLPEKLSDMPLSAHSVRRGQRLYPVVGSDGLLAGVVTRRELKQLAAAGRSAKLHDFIRRNPVVAYSDEPLRMVVYRMAETGLTRMPVVEDHGSRKLVGMISLEDLLRARVRHLEEERRRERVLRIHLPFGGDGEERHTSGVSSGSVSDSSGGVN
jgi:CBS domain-containing protein